MHGSSISAVIASDTATLEADGYIHGQHQLHTDRGGLNDLLCCSDGCNKQDYCTVLQWRAEGRGLTPPKFRRFDKVEPDCKLCENV